MSINEHQKPWTITQEELDLRWQYKSTRMTFKEFERRYNELIRQGKIIRNGKVISQIR